MYPVPLEVVGPRLRLVSPCPAHSDSSIACLLSDQATMKYLLAMSRAGTSSCGGWSEKDAQKRREQQEVDQTAGKGWFCAIVESATSAVVGICGLRSIDWHNCSGEMGIILAAEHWGRGYSSEAHMLMLQVSFEDLHLNRIVMITAARNYPMINFCKNVLLATHEGTLRDRFPMVYGDPSKGFEDAELFTLLARDWPATCDSLTKQLSK